MAQTRPLSCIITSALTIVTGIILLIAALVIVKDTDYLRNYWTQIYGLSIFSIVIAVLAIIGAIGLIYVVNRQFPALTTLFSGFLILIAFLAILCITILATGRTDLERKTYYNTAQIFLNYSDSDLIKSSKATVGFIQQSYECCGIESAADWKSLIPDSCCKEVTEGCGKEYPSKQDNIYVHGCAGIVYDAFRRKYSILIGTNVVLVLFTLISAILGIIYERYIRQQYQSM